MELDEQMLQVLMKLNHNFTHPTEPIPSAVSLFNPDRQLPYFYTTILSPRKKETKESIIAKHAQQRQIKTEVKN